MFLIVGENSPTFPIAAYLRPLRLGRYFQKWYIKWPPTSSTRSFIFHIDQEITTLTSPTWTIILKPVRKTALKLFRHCRLFFSNVPQNFLTLTVTIDYVGVVGLSEKSFSNTIFENDLVAEIGEGVGPLLNWNPSPTCLERSERVLGAFIEKS